MRKNFHLAFIPLLFLSSSASKGNDHPSLPSQFHARAVLLTEGGAGQEEGWSTGDLLYKNFTIPQYPKPSYRYSVYAYRSNFTQYKIDDKGCKYVNVSEEAFDPLSLLNKANRISGEKCGIKSEGIKFEYRNGYQTIRVCTSKDGKQLIEYSNWSKGDLESREIVTNWDTKKPDPSIFNLPKICW